MLDIEIKDELLDDGMLISGTSDFDDCFTYYILLVDIIGNEKNQYGHNELIIRYAAILFKDLGQKTFIYMYTCRYACKCVKTHNLIIL